MSEKGCTCMSCDMKFLVDLILPDNVWAWLGLDHTDILCGPCIMARVERQSRGPGYLIVKDAGIT